MKVFCFLALLGVFAANVQAYEVVCYIPTWINGLASKCDPSLCTMFNIAFGSVNAAGNVVVPDNIATFRQLKSGGAKLLLALGGASDEQAYAFSAIASNPNTRATFAQNCINVMASNGLDGIDIDWEFPTASDSANYVLLHSDLKAKFAGKYILSTAVMPGNYKVKEEKRYDIKGLGKAVDFINLMTYDFHSDASWDSYSGVYFNAPVTAGGDSVENGINLFISGGAPANILNVGAPFYARTYNLANANSNTPGSQFSGTYQNLPAYTPGYNTYCSNIKSSAWVKKRDTNTLCPYMYSGNQWMSYEDEQSIKDKGNLAKKHGLAGVMSWALHQDDYDGVCSSCKWPLLKALASTVGKATACSGSSNNNNSNNNNNVVVVPTNPPPTNPPPVVTTKKSDGGGGGGGGGSSSLTCPGSGDFSHPTDCKKFLKCGAAGAVPDVFTCAGDLLWNKAGYCDWSCKAY